jgi:hypothetical protein
MASLRRVSLADGPSFVAIMQGHIVPVAYAATFHDSVIITHRR